MLTIIFSAGTTVVCVTTGASVSVASIPRLLAGVERPLVSLRSDKLYIYQSWPYYCVGSCPNSLDEAFLFRQFPEMMLCPRKIMQLWNLNILYRTICFLQLLRAIWFWLDSCGLTLYIYYCNLSDLFLLFVVPTWCKWLQYQCYFHSVSYTALFVPVLSCYLHCS